MIDPNSRGEELSPEQSVNFEQWEKSLQEVDEGLLARVGITAGMAIFGAYANAKYAMGNFRDDLPNRTKNLKQRAGAIVSAIATAAAVGHPAAYEAHRESKKD